MSDIDELVRCCAVAAIVRDSVGSRHSRTGGSGAHIVAGHMEVGSRRTVALDGESCGFEFLNCHVRRWNVIRGATVDCNSI